MKTGRALLVQAQACVVQFTVEHVEVAVLEGIDDEQHHVSRTDHAEDFLPAALAFCSTLDQNRAVQNLDFRTAVLHDAGDARQRREGVRTGLRMRVGDLGDERGFSDRWETDQGHRGIARLADLEALARTGAPRRGRGLFLLEFELGDLGLQLPNVGVCGLVFLGLMDLVQERLNLLLDRRHASSPSLWSASQASTSPLEQARERGLKHAKHALKAWASSWCSFSLTGLGWPRFLSALGRG